jgi:hypothetical protein
MKIWNFAKQSLDEGVEPPACNGVDPGAKQYKAVNISYNRKEGETIVEYIEEKDKL